MTAYLVFGLPAWVAYVVVGAVFLAVLLLAITDVDRRRAARHRAQPPQMWLERADLKPTAQEMADYYAAGRRRVRQAMEATDDA